MTLRDSVALYRAFAIRPKTIAVRQSVAGQRRNRTAAVEYVDPIIPEPNAATLAEYARARRAYEASQHEYIREIAASDENADKPLQLRVGGSVVQTVFETHRHFDAIIGFDFDGSISWTIDDTTIATVRIASPDTSNGSITISLTVPARVTGRRPGRTTLRADLGPSRSDTALSVRPPARKLAREVIVLPAVDRIELTGPRGPVRVGARVEFRVRALDPAGKAIAREPIDVSFASGNHAKLIVDNGRFRQVFSAPGSEAIIASFLGKADTLVVNVAKE